MDVSFAESCIKEGRVPEDVDKYDAALTHSLRLPKRDARVRAAPMFAKWKKVAVVFKDRVKYRAYDR